MPDDPELSPQHSSSSENEEISQSVRDAMNTKVLLANCVISNKGHTV